MAVRAKTRPRIPERSKPYRIWTRYTVVSWRGVKITKGDYVAIRLPGDEAIARVREIRAKDRQSGYLRITWLYRPHEVSIKRDFSFYGKDELIYSNHEQYINCKTVERLVEVEYWHPSRKEPLRNFYFRQNCDIQGKVLKWIEQWHVCPGARICSKSPQQAFRRASYVVLLAGWAAVLGEMPYVARPSIGFHDRRGPRATDVSSQGQRTTRGASGGLCPFGTEGESSGGRLINPEVL
ncbi:reverse transcriptase- RNaseH [Apiospora marii]|uniref:reverse transcriptase- RNaseH n=1 Tax=Apiospora marii TaxID=335849 RepID=UPI00312D7403